MSRIEEPASSLQRPPYYVAAKSHPFSFKPYDWREAKRDRHVCHDVSYRLSAAVRRLRREKRADTKDAGAGAERLTTDRPSDASLHRVTDGRAHPTAPANTHE